MPMGILLSILIPTIDGREVAFNELYGHIQAVILHFGLTNEVEVLFLKDDKEMTIGEKRERLYAMANGVYAWQIDDDDSIPWEAIPRIVSVIKQEPTDCITFEEACTIDGVKSRSNFSMHYPGWAENKFGYDHVRTPFFKTPILTSICRQVPVPHVRWGEDALWAQAIKPLLKSETHFPVPLYHYNHISSPHNERYGIKD